jgi:ParB/Sulfiredoxin domain
VADLAVTLRNARHEVVPVTKLTPHPRNPRQGDLGAIAESIRAHGFYGSLVVQESTGHICAGNHRYRAAVQLGLKELPVDWIDCTDEEALRILVADNRASDLAMNDGPILADLLRELSATTEGLFGTLYAGDDLDDLIAQMDDPLVIGDAARVVSGMRALVFSFTPDDYERVVRQLEQLRRARALDSHKAVVVALVTDAVGPP